MTTQILNATRYVISTIGYNRKMWVLCCLEDKRIYGHLAQYVFEIYSSFELKSSGYNSKLSSVILF